jgi:hypothetical protein
MDGKRHQCDFKKKNKPKSARRCLSSATFILEMSKEDYRLQMQDNSSILKRDRIKKYIYETLYSVAN